MIFTFMAVIAFLATVTVCAADIRKLRIPDAGCAAIAVTFLMAFFSAPERFSALSGYLGVAAAVFAVTFFLFARGWLGAGDAKLATALSLWVGLNGLSVYLFATLIMGGALAFAALVIQKKKPFRAPPSGRWIDQLQRGGNKIPYGVAIGTGAWAAVLMNYN